jgi:hypothetical protein
VSYLRFTPCPGDDPHGSTDLTLASDYQRAKELRHKTEPPALFLATDKDIQAVEMKLSYLHDQLPLTKSRCNGRANENNAESVCFVSRAREYPRAQIRPADCNGAKLGVEQWQTVASARHLAQYQLQLGVPERWEATWHHATMRMKEEEAGCTL